MCMCLFVGAFVCLRVRLFCPSFLSKFVRFVYCSFNVIVSFARLFVCLLVSFQYVCTTFCLFVILFV